MVGSLAPAASVASTRNRKAVLSSLDNVQNLKYYVPSAASQTPLDEDKFEYGNQILESVNLELAEPDFILSLLGTLWIWTVS